MLLWSFLLALILILGGVLAQLMIADSGVVLISWNNWMVETTLWGAVGIGLSIVCLFILLSALWKRFGPAQLLSSYRNRRNRKAAKKETAIAIESWLKGSDERALTALSKVIKAGGSDRLPSAISLVIGMQQSDWPERYAAFVNEDAELKLFADAIQAERFLQSGKQEDFVDLMLARFELRQIPWLRERFWQAMLEFNKAAELVGMINEAANIQPDAREAWLIKAANRALVQSHGDADAGTQILKPLSKAQKNLPDITEAEINYLVSVGHHDAAFKRAKLLLNSEVKLERSNVLLDIQTDNLQKLSFLESMQPLNPGAVFCRVLGVLNMRQQLWGNAQSLLEQGWQQGDKASGLHLAELFEQRNMKEQAARLYRELATGVVAVY
jgi:uncharacterized protein HemY